MNTFFKKIKEKSTDIEDVNIKESTPFLLNIKTKRKFDELPEYNEDLIQSIKKLKMSNSNSKKEQNKPINYISKIDIFDNSNTSNSSMNNFEDVEMREEEEIKKKNARLFFIKFRAMLLERYKKEISKYNTNFKITDRNTYFPYKECCDNNK